MGAGQGQSQQQQQQQQQQQRAAAQQNLFAPQQPMGSQPMGLPQPQQAFGGAAPQQNFFAPQQPMGMASSQQAFGMTSQQPMQPMGMVRPHVACVIQAACRSYRVVKPPRSSRHLAWSHNNRCSPWEWPRSSPLSACLRNNRWEWACPRNNS